MHVAGIKGDEVLKSGPSKICGRQSLKNFKFPKGSLPQILLGPLLNTWTYMLHFLRLNIKHSQQNVFVIFYMLLNSSFH